MQKYSIFTGIMVILGIVSLSYAYAEIQFDSEFGGTGTGTEELNNPTDVVLSADGSTVYVADSKNDRINAFEDDGDHDFEFGSFCSVFSISDCNVNADGANADGDGQFDTTFGISLDKNGDVFVVDSENYRIQKFDNNGFFELKFGSTDSADDDYLPDPRGITILDSTNEVFVSSVATDTISVFDSSGNFAFDFDSFGTDTFANPTYLLIDNTDGMLYVSDSGNDQIVIFRLVDGTTCPSGTEKIEDGVCFVEKFGTTGSDDGEFDSPGGIAIDTTTDLLYVADTDNDRIQVLSLDAGTLSVGPDSPTGVNSLPLSPTSVLVTWDEPEDSEITGYKIEYREGSASYTSLISDTKNNAISFVHEGLDSTTTYYYRVSAIDAEGTSNPATSNSISPEHTDAPAGLVADAISPTQIKLTWYPPSNTFNQQITGYEVKRVLSNGAFDPIDSTDSTTFIVNNLETDRTYSFVVSATLTTGATNESNEASATPSTDSVENSDASSAKPKSAPTAPTNLRATPISNSQINLSWGLPSNQAAVTGYKIEVKKDSGSFTVLDADTETTLRSYQHKNLSTDSQYTYRVYAINDLGTSDASDEIKASPLTKTLQLATIGSLSVDEKSIITFTAKPTESSFSNVVYSLSSNAPSGSQINANSGKFSWTPTDSQGGRTYVFDVVGMQGSMIDTVSVAITVKDTSQKEPEPIDEPPETLPIPALFVEKTKTPQYYVDRYLNEPKYKEWFDENYPEYDSIYQAVGLPEPVEVAPFIEDKDPRYYVVRYTYEQNYKEWFDTTYPEYDSIYQAVGLPEKELTNYGYCGEGTKLIDGVCTVINPPK